MVCLQFEQKDVTIWIEGFQYRRMDVDYLYAYIEQYYQDVLSSTSFYIQFPAEISCRHELQVNRTPSVFNKCKGHVFNKTLVLYFLEEEWNRGAWTSFKDVS